MGNKMKVKNLKKEKVKRSRIVLSAILTIIIALASLGFGAYFGYVTLNINYVTIGTMTPVVGGLLVVAGFFIFFGCVGGTIAIKELFIASRNEEKFSAYKGALISALVYYCIIAVICLVGLIMSLVSYIPSEYTWTIFALCILTLLLCAGAFYCVLKEIKEHKKKKKQFNNGYKGNFAYNMNMSAQEIGKFKEFIKDTKESERNKLEKEISEKYKGSEGEENLTKERALEILYEKNESSNGSKKDGETKALLNGLDFNYLATNLKKLEELRKSGLINDQEYQELKRSLIK